MLYVHYEIFSGKKYELWINKDLSYEKWMKYHDYSSDGEYKYNTLSEKMLKKIKYPENIKNILLEDDLYEMIEVNLVKFVNIQKLKCKGYFNNITNSLVHLINLIDISVDLRNGLIGECKLYKSVNIKNITIENSCLNDIQGLSGLSNLVNITIPNNEHLETLRGIEQCINLEVLVCNNCNIKSVNELSNLTKLNFLNINENRVTSIRCLARLINLNTLICSCNGIDTLNGIENMEKLETLICFGNIIDTIDPVKKLPNIHHFSCDIHQNISHNVIRFLIGSKYEMTQDVLEYDKLYTSLSTTEIDSLSNYLIDKEDVLIKYNYNNFVSSDYFFNNRHRLVKKIKAKYRNIGNIIEVKNTEDGCCICDDSDFKRYVECINGHVICDDCFKLIPYKDECCVCKIKYDISKVYYFIKD